MATKTTKPPEQTVATKQVEAKKLTASEALVLAEKKGWLRDNHPLASQRFYRNSRTGQVTRNIEEVISS